VPQRPRPPQFVTRETDPWGENPFASSASRSVVPDATERTASSSPSTTVRPTASAVSSLVSSDTGGRSDAGVVSVRVVEPKSLYRESK
jgi:hypothetical protein